MSDQSTARRGGMGWLFFDDARRPRAFWRILFFVSVAVVLAIAASAVLAATRVRDLTPEGLPREFFDRSLMLLVTAAATAVAARVTERRSFGDVGFGLRPGWWRELVYGTAFGAAVLLSTVLAGAALGWFSGGFHVVSAGLLAWLAVWMVAAAWEELLMRGFVFQALGSGLGWPAAVVLTSALFAAGHLGNPNLVPEIKGIAMAVTFAAGVLLAIAYLRTRSLWLATGVHLGWNFAMGTLLGLPVSGTTQLAGAALDRDALLLATETGPDLATGGAYGPEAGLVALLVIGGSCAVLARLPVPRGRELGARSRVSDAGRAE